MAASDAEVVILQPAGELLAAVVPVPVFVKPFVVGSLPVQVKTGTMPATREIDDARQFLVGVIRALANDNRGVCHPGVVGCSDLPLAGEAAEAFDGERDQARRGRADLPDRGRGGLALVQMLAIAQLYGLITEDGEIDLEACGVILDDGRSRGITPRIAAVEGKSRINVSEQIKLKTEQGTPSIRA